MAGSRDSGCHYGVPSAEDLPARVSGVLAVLYLILNEGYLATGPQTHLVRGDLTTEAIRLTRIGQSATAMTTVPSQVASGGDSP